MTDSRHDPSPAAISDQVMEDLRRLAPDLDFRVPDSTECVEGWRAWGVPLGDIDKRMPRLYSVTQHHYWWAPRKRAHAECLRGHRTKFTAPRGGLHTCKGIVIPNEHCTCGFYSAKTYEHLQSMTYHCYDAEANGLFHIVGRVANWGKVIEGGQGWRAEFSYPLELFVPFEAWRLCRPLESLYGVPSQLKNTLESQSTTSEEA